MAQSKVNLANMALWRIGARGVITSLEEGSANAEVVSAVWDAVFQEVLSERDWKFAKLRAEIQKSSLTPLYGYQYAYVLPSDFLRLVKPRGNALRGVNPLYYAYPNYLVGSYLQPISVNDAPVWPPGIPYVIETVLDESENTERCLLSDYDNTYGSLYINYIRIITDMNLLPPGFANCFINRLAAELALPVRESEKLKDAKMNDYTLSLSSAQAQNECLDFLENETGSTDWADAGR